MWYSLFSSVLILPLLLFYIYACSLITKHRSKKFSAFEAFCQSFFLTPVVGVLINILAKLED